MVKNLTQLFIGLCGLLLFLAVNIYISYGLFSPLFGNDDLVKFSYIPFGVMIHGATYGLCISAFVAFWRTLKEVVKNQPKTPKKLLWKLMIILSGAGGILNYANYYLVIKPNNMVQCPLKMGYKSNLMRDYVKDLSQCEK